MKNSFVLILILLFFINIFIDKTQAQDVNALLKLKWMLDAVPPAKGLGGNGISDLLVQEFPDSTIIWAGTGGGLSRLNVQTDKWYTYNSSHGLGKGGVSAITLRGNEIWVATVYDSVFKDVGSVYIGGGLTYSRDGGKTWTHVPQPSDTKIPGNNTTWDIAMLDSTVWITSWAGGMRYTDDRGKTWKVVTPDGFILNPVENLNHNSWSIINADGILWLGTAGGINKSLDGGRTWVNFTHQNQAQPICGNWARQIACQKYDDKEVIWVACWTASSESEDSTEFYGVARSEDQGYTWTNYLEGERAFSFAFDGPTVYVVAENGLFKSADQGQTWAKYPPIRDVAQDVSVYSSEYYAAAITKNSTLWVGTSDGLAKTENDGLSWHIFRAVVPTGVGNEPRTYSYPNPFSPMRYNNLDGTGYIRLQYNTKAPAAVTIKVYDFALDLVATVVSGKSRPAGDFHEVWDCKNDRLELVANGVYFYSVEISGDGTYWGKIMIVD